uniref:Uncharacterized protein n=1 Tax=Rhizophora mucronata TaxID=61149 RepID=A0A2P2NLJ8_RHIMU
MIVKTKSSVNSYFDSVQLNFPHWERTL